MQKEIISLSQNDRRWRDLTLGDNSGTPKSTIGRYGCMLTCIDMLLNYYIPGFDNLTPDVLNYLLVKYNGFYKEQYIIHSTINRIYPELEYTETIKCKHEPAPVEYINNKLPLLIKVDSDLSDSDVDAHWVLGVGGIGNIAGISDIEIVDPWYGDIIPLLSRYARKGWDISRAIFGAIDYEPVSYFN